jgi:hypothetical protein
MNGVGLQKKKLGDADTNPVLDKLSNLIEASKASDCLRSRMPHRHLLHLTSSLENVASILEWGLLFTYNPIEILEQLLGRTFAHTLAPAPGGMICLTELPYPKAKKVFGAKKYGIAVDKEWAKSVGAQPVEYVNPTQEADLSKLRDANFHFLSKGFPAETNCSDHLARWLLELGATNPNFARSLGLDQEFLSFQKRVLWMQTSGHAEEQEWRIRSPQGYPNIEVLPKQDKQLELLLGMVMNIPSVRQLLTLRIPPEVVVGVFVPAGRADEAKNLVREFGLAEACVNPP